MDITRFDDLLQAAKAQPEPQRLLFVFTTAGLPDDATPAQRAGFAAGEGGTLTPLTCVDKRPDELMSFDALREESRQAAPAWDIVFVAALAGSSGLAPSDAQTDAALERMVASIQAGQISGFVPFDAAGKAVMFG